MRREGRKVTVTGLIQPENPRADEQSRIGSPSSAVCYLQLWCLCPLFRVYYVIMYFVQRKYVDVYETSRCGSVRKDIGTYVVQ